ncbi:MAG: hypothetical protein HY681_04490 [Chloroflexi bacterium]|nr:hypothetical protein [Chloroflexota bacterium]
MIDGREATQRVKDYFLTAHGEFGVLGFQVEGASFNETTKQWVIRSAFLASLGAQKRTTYEVRLSEEGQILEVKKIVPEAA